MGGMGMDEMDGMDRMDRMDRMDLVDLADRIDLVDHIDLIDQMGSARRSRRWAPRRDDLRPRMVTLGALPARRGIKGRGPWRFHRNRGT